MTDVWKDPMSYDAVRDGPPYLKEGSMKLAARIACRYQSKVATQRIRASLSPETTEMLAGALASLMGDNGGAPYSELTAILSFLRAVALTHQTHHWQTRGPQSYSDHLLFERIYNGANEDIDPIAERAVGAGERLLVRPMLQADQLERIMGVVYTFAAMDPSSQDYVLLSCNAETAFLCFTDLAVESMRNRGLLSRGIDNLIAGIQDRHESHIYLLRQRLGV